MIYGYYNLFNIARYPDLIFSGLFKFIFSWLIPVIIVANYPARLLMRSFENPFPLMFQLLVAAIFITLMCRLFWLFALKRYSSASS